MTNDDLHIVVECLVLILDPLEAFDPALAGALGLLAGAEGAAPQKVPFNYVCVLLFAF